MIKIISEVLLLLFPRTFARRGVGLDALMDFLSKMSNFQLAISTWYDILKKRSIPDHARVMRFNALMGLPDGMAGRFETELDFIRKRGIDGVVVFPYEKVGESDSTPESGYDERLRLPYVIHKGKRLYFPGNSTADEALGVYRYFIETEGLLGTGCLARSPHSYVSDDFCVEAGDVVVDVGCSEGLFALDNSDKASRIYVFEAEKKWRKPIFSTFSGMDGKVKIFNKYVGAKASKNSILLSDALSEESSDGRFFIKMDIEGAEREVIRASESFFRTHKVKLACAAYHRHDDAKVLKKMLEDMGFECWFSSGYMLFDEDCLCFPYFRHGMLYAKNYNDTIAETREEYPEIIIAGNSPSPDTRVIAQRCR